MSTTSKIRGLEKSDTPRLLDLLSQMDAEDGHSRASRISAAHLEEFVFGPAPRAEALVAESDQRLVGLAAFHMSASTFWLDLELYLDDLYVAPDFRRAGVGRRLMSRLAEITTTRSAHRILLNVQSDNEIALRFYRSLGGCVFPDSRGCAISDLALGALAKIATT